MSCGATAATCWRTSASAGLLPMMPSTRACAVRARGVGVVADAAAHEEAVGEDGDVAREDLGAGAVVLGERARAVAVLEVEDAERREAPMGAQRTASMRFLRTLRRRGSAGRGGRRAR